MAKKAESILIKLAIFILFCAVGIAIGFAAAGYWTNLNHSGAFVKWQLLDSPLKFKHLVATSASEIWAYAEDGSFYMYKSDFCNDTPGKTCGQWLELDPESEFGPEMKKLIRSGCEAVYDYYSVESRYPPQPEASPTECAITQTNDPFFGTTTLTYYVLLDNGKVWMWKHKPDIEKEIILSLFINLSGLILGIIVWFIFRQKFAHFIDKHLGVTQ